MAVTTISGDLATDVINSAQRVIDMDNSISELEPNNAPFVAMLRKLSSKPAISPKVEWLESVSMPRFDTLSASATSGATALGATNPTYFRVGDLVRITETGEAIEITGVSASAIGANRAIWTTGVSGGVSAAASATSAAGLFIVGNVNAEGASLRSIKTVKLTNQFNYAQILRTPFGVTGTEYASKLYGQDANDRVRLQRVGGLEHERQIEQTAFWGARKEDTSTSGAPKRFAGGLFEFISTNNTNANGALTRAVFETFLRAGFRYGSDHKVLYASPLVMAAIDGFAWNGGTSATSRVVYDSPASTLGVNVKQYVCSQGVVDIVMKRHWNDNTNLKGDAFLVDMNNVSIRPLRDTKLLLERQANDADKVEDEYLTEVSFEIQQEATHSILTGVTG